MTDTLGNVLRRYIDAIGWTQADLQRESGVHKSTISLILKGERGIGIGPARKIERATIKARELGKTSLEPLWALTLMELPTGPANDADATGEHASIPTPTPSPTGTGGR